MATDNTLLTKEQALTQVKESIQETESTIKYLFTNDYFMTAQSVDIINKYRSNLKKQQKLYEFISLKSND